jgi:LPS O-antigen subunit length determinant protein (WzzB/FepE family)
VGRTLEAIFRRPWRLVLMLLLFPIIGLAIGYALPRTYVSSAALWANRRYGVIGTTGAEQNINDSPAGTQATALVELLQSREFALTIAKATDLPSTIDVNDSKARDDALVKEIANVKVEAKEYSLYTITYSNKNPDIAQQIVQATIDKFGTKSQTLSIADATRRIAADKAQLPQTKATAQQTAQATQNYKTQHPELSAVDLENDAQYLLLKQQSDQAATNVQTIQNEIDTLTQMINSQGSKPDDLFSVQDKPIVPDKPESLMRILLIGGGGGLAIALLASAMYLVIVIRRDRAIYSVQDLQKITTLPIALQVPQLDPQTLSLLISKATASPQLPYINKNS